mgnify:CR=1 FL=1
MLFIRGRKEGGIKVHKGKYLIVDGKRVFGFYKVIPSVHQGPGQVIEQFYAQARLRGFFEAIYKSKIPLVYLVLSKPRKEGMELVCAIGSWEEWNERREGEVLSKLEENLNVIKASLSVALPNVDLVRVERGEIRNLWDFASLKGVEMDYRNGAYLHSSVLPSLDVGSIGIGQPARPKFYVPPPNEGGIKLGKVLVDGVERHYLHIDPNNIVGHVCIMGMTGSGKTNTAKVIVKELVRLGIPVLVLDVHNEYDEVMREIGGNVVAPGKDEFVLNPIAPFRSRDISEHVALITDIFTDVYKFTFPQSFIFRSALMKLLSEEEVAGGYPHTLGGLVEVIETYPVKSAYDNETKLALLRRLLPLVEGQAGRALNGKSTFNIEELLRDNVAIQLGYFKDFETRSIFATMLLKMIFDYRTSFKNSKWIHVTVIEEARHIVPIRRLDEPARVGEKMVNELRKFGEGMIFIAQFPSQISHEVIKNSAIKIAHRISWSEDVKVLSGAMGLTSEQSAYLSHLQVGEAIVSSPELHAPVHVKIDLAERKLNEKPYNIGGRGYY